MDKKQEEIGEKKKEEVRREKSNAKQTNADTKNRNEQVVKRITKRRKIGDREKKMKRKLKIDIEYKYMIEEKEE